MSVSARRRAPRRGPPFPGPWLRGLFFCAVAGIASLAACQSAGPLTEGHGPLGLPQRVGTIAAAAINESSGIVASRRDPGVYWTMNDSGGGAHVYAIDAAGKLLRSVAVAGARSVDWEDIAADESGRLYVADVGDNNRQRAEVAIYAFDEPGPDDRQVKVHAATRFKYAAGLGPVDCEAMFVYKGYAYLISKELLGARLHRVKLAGPEDKELATAEHLGAVPGIAWVTAADITPDGRHLAVLSYTAVCVYDLPKPIDELAAPAPAAETKEPPATQAAAAAKETPATQAATTRPVKVITVAPRKRLITLRQAEAVCWVLDKPPTDLLITNEQREIYRVQPTKKE